jgi:hypothetical protein
MTFNLASGHIKIMTDTANDEDCTNQCAVKSLADFVNTGGGWHGINGTYFCPADYAGCAGEVNSFFWKIYNSRLGKMINEKNGLGEWEPFLAFDSGGQARYFSRWDQRGSYPNYAGINSKPALVSGGRNVLNENDLDTKQLTVKSNRGALGLKGDSLYAVIAKGATVIDLAAIMESLGMDYALNIDGGGSSAMIYKGSYKVGPGRGIPNALIVVEK